MAKVETKTPQLTSEAGRVLGFAGPQPETPSSLGDPFDVLPDRSPGTRFSFEDFLKFFPQEVVDADDGNLRTAYDLLVSMGTEGVIGRDAAERFLREQPLGDIDRIEWHRERIRAFIESMAPMVKGIVDAPGKIVSDCKTSAYEAGKGATAGWNMAWSAVAGCGASIWNNTFGALGTALQNHKELRKRAERSGDPRDDARYLASGAGLMVSLVGLKGAGSLVRATTGAGVAANVSQGGLAVAAATTDLAVSAEGIGALGASAIGAAAFLRLFDGVAKRQPGFLESMTKIAGDAAQPAVVRCRALKALKTRGEFSFGKFPRDLVEAAIKDANPAAARAVAKLVRDIDGTQSMVQMTKILRGLLERRKAMGNSTKLTGADAVAWQEVTQAIRSVRRDFNLRQLSSEQAAVAMAGERVLGLGSEKVTLLYALIDSESGMITRFAKMGEPAPTGQSLVLFGIDEAKGVVTSAYEVTEGFVNQRLQPHFLESFKGYRTNVSSLKRLFE